MEDIITSNGHFEMNGSEVAVNIIIIISSREARVQIDSGFSIATKCALYPTINGGVLLGHIQLPSCDKMTSV